MLVAVTYDNPYYEEHNEYTSTLAEVMECFDGIAINVDRVAGELKKSGEAVIKNGYATTTITSPYATVRLAEEFADIIRNELNDDELEIANQRNAENGYKKESCATNDFIDANQSMLDAMESLNIEVDLDSDKQITLINKAWQMAMESNYTLNSWNPGDQANPAVMCEFCQTIDTPIGGNYIMTVSEEECKWFDRENHKTNNSAGRISRE